MLVFIKRNNPTRYFKARCPHCKSKFIFDSNEVRPWDDLDVNLKCRVCCKYIRWRWNYHEISERKFQKLVNKYETKE